ncbi:methyltransferase domain-containing protein [bacterium]|nr:methyltransferase domain-containing protein [Candidatus Elulimicrobium humile]
MTMPEVERSTETTHKENPDQFLYDDSYYKVLKPHITGKVLDVGAGALMFVKEYLFNEDVESVLAIDKYVDDFETPTIIKKNWVCPEPLPEGKFDTIVSTEFIEHIERDQLEPLLEQIKDRLSGKFVGSTPNKRVPTTNPFHLYEYTLDELREILEKYFNTIHIEDTGFGCTVWIAQN